MGNLTTIIFKKADFNKLCEHLFSTRELEAMAVAFFSVSQSPRRTKLLVRGLSIPRDEDYSERSAYYVALGAEFMEQCFCRCEETETHVMDIHTHPWSDTPDFSSIDDSEALVTKVPYLNKWLPETRIAFALLGSDASRIAARLWNEAAGDFESVSKIYII